MSLSLALNNALTGLKVSQRALSVISQNVANANTEGYSRQEVDLSAVYLDGVGAGVKVEDISRRVDVYLQRAIRRQTSEVGRTQVAADYAEKLQILLGQPGASNSIDEHVSVFFNALQNLAESPERVSLRERAVDAGMVLAREISTLARGLEDLRMEADRDVVRAIDDVNEQIRNLDTLNVAIQRADVLGNPVSGLQDQQDAALKKLAENLEITTYTLDNGAIHVFGPDGIGVLDDSVYELDYSPADAIGSFIESVEMRPLEVYRLDEGGNRSTSPLELVSGGLPGSIDSKIDNGKIKALLDIRDTTAPDILAQLDSLAATLRDTFNAIHNGGSSYPGAQQLTGTREIAVETRNSWQGGVTIAVLQEDGTPAPSAYSDETHTGVRPLHLDLTFLDGGFGAGEPDAQAIIDEINNHFWPPPVKTVIGNMNGIQLVSDTNDMPSATVPPIFSFDFDLENISGENAEFYVTDIQVFDDAAANITNVATPPPFTALNAANTYTTTAGSATVTIAAAGHTFSVGDRIFLSDPGAAVNGIPQASMTGYFEITGTTATGFDIAADAPATATGAVSVAGMTATPPWDLIEPGDKRRVRDAGIVDLDLTAAPSSSYYDIVVDIGVDDRSDVPANITTAQVTYRVYNFREDQLNDRYNSSAITGNGERLVPNTDQRYIVAKLVDENGDELAKTPDGDYISDYSGFLQLTTNDPNHRIAIEENDSKEDGLRSAVPTRPGTGRGFSHYFELNNFFASNAPTQTGDTEKNSAINLAVEERFDDDANLITTGNLTSSLQSPDPEDPPIYTLERFSGENERIQDLAKLGADFQSFGAAGGLASANVTFNSYASQILAFVSSGAARSDADNRDSNILLDGLTERSDTFSGVNIDEEMANTIVYQHAYTASARVITVTDQLFQALLGAFSG